MTYSSEVLADSPLAYYRMGDTSGTTMTDSSGNGHNGTYGGYAGTYTLNAGSLLTGDADPSVDCSGGGHSATGASWMIPSLTTLSFECIIRPDTVSAGSYNFIAVRDDNNGTGNVFWLVLKATKLTALCRGTEFSGSTTIVANTTYHVAFTYDGTTAKLYVNGSLDGSSARSGNMSSANHDLIIGRWGNAGSPLPFDGRIDEAAYYGTALSSGRISAHYTAATTVTTAATGTGALTLSGSGAAGGVASGSGSLTLSASGAANTAASGSGSLTLSGSGVVTFQPASGSGSLSLSGAGAAGIGASGSGAITLSGAGTAVASTAASGTGSLTLSGSGSATLADSGTAFLTLSATGAAEALYVTDTSNLLNGRNRRAVATATVTRPAAATPSRAAVKYDKSVPYPPPTLVNGRPT